MIYFEAKIIAKMKEVCGAISHKMDELIVRNTSGWNSDHIEVITT